ITPPDKTPKTVKTPVAPRFGGFGGFVGGVQGRGGQWRERRNSAAPRSGVGWNDLLGRSMRRDWTAGLTPVFTDTYEKADRGHGNRRRDPCSQTSIDCWAKIPAVAPCDDARVTEGMRGLARSPAA